MDVMIQALKIQFLASFLALMGLILQMTQSNKCTLRSCHNKLGLCLIGFLNRTTVYQEPLL